jgi:bacteriocin biosynthesis cyclodehydratase domain-containing protein
VLRRDAGHVQVGLDPGHALVLPDSAEVRALLAAVTDPAATLGGEHDPAVRRRLLESGLVVDADTLLPLMPHRPQAAPGGARPSRSAVAAVAAQEGDAAGRALLARRDCVVEVLTAGAAEVTRVADSLTSLLTQAGVASRSGSAPSPVARRAGTVPRQATGPGRETQLVGLVVAVGEPSRELVDPWVRDGVPHLVLRLVEGHAVVGPFVEPGRTACLRCLDAHHTDVDPAWPLLVTQYASAVARVRDDTVPEPVDPLLAAIAAAWGARELVSHVEGRRPATASATVRLDPHLTALESQGWPRHPACGCSWG